jgi:hypothetical protein
LIRKIRNTATRPAGPALLIENALEQHVTGSAVDAGVAPLARLVHSAVPGRARFEIAGLYHDDALAQMLPGRLRRRSWISAASASPLTGRLLVLFDPGRARAARRYEQPPWRRAHASAEYLLAFFELQGELADQGLEPRVLAFEPALALWGAGRLERARGIGRNRSRHW